MDPVSASVITGLVAALVAAGGISINAVRGNGKTQHENGQATKLLELFLDNQGSIVQSLERLMAADERLADINGRIIDRLDRLVEVHLKSEPTIGRLEKIMDELDDERRERARAARPGGE